MRRLATGVGLGLILGWAAAHALFLHWWTLVPWGLAGLALGYRAKRAGAVTAGAGYGFVLCFVFTLASYGGAAPAFTRVPFFTVLGCVDRSEEHTSELQSPYDLVCRLLLEKKKKTINNTTVTS